MSEQRQLRDRIRASLAKSAPMLLRWGSMLGSTKGLAGGIAVIAAVYLTHDLVKGRFSPCESLYEQTAIGLKTHIRFLEHEAQLELGKASLTELDERGQMAALNLKT